MILCQIRHHFLGSCPQTQFHSEVPEGFNTHIQSARTQHLQGSVSLDSAPPSHQLTTSKAKALPTSPPVPPAAPEGTFYIRLLLQRMKS